MSRNRKRRRQLSPPQPSSEAPASDSHNEPDEPEEEGSTAPSATSAGPDATDEARLGKFLTLSHHSTSTSLHPTSTLTLFHQIRTCDTTLQESNQYCLRFL
ncbi:hypothetical protein H4Q26_006366 [Puccinia striiformis f. sp. tritici PST-130]|nr:hypothetical protein H4Q26_006366 [Puccinia striiformis f. sp. tritici PST-130]